MTTKTSKIIWTKIDEAPLLASYSLLPIIRAFTKGTGVEVETMIKSTSGGLSAVIASALAAALVARLAVVSPFSAM